MRYLVFLILFSFLSAHPLMQQSCGASDKSEEARFPAEIEKLVQEILTSKYPYESPSDMGIVKGYRTLFKKVGAKGIRELQTHPNDGISIQAAWETVALTVPEMQQKEKVRPDRHKLDWFLGFLEGRARLKVPSWWSEVVLDSRAKGKIYPGDPKESPFHKLGLDDAYGPDDTSLNREDDKVVLRIGKQSVAIPENLLHKTSDGKIYCSVSALMNPSRCCVAVYGNVGTPYKLTCIDRTTGKILWKSDVFGTWWGGSTGIHYMWVTVTEQNDRIVLFGAASTGIHVEAFREKDGKNLFRFSSSY
jgi:hypothetical protein